MVPRAIKMQIENSTVEVWVDINESDIGPSDGTKPVIASLDRISNVLGNLSHLIVSNGGNNPKGDTALSECVIEVGISFDANGNAIIQQGTDKAHFKITLRAVPAWSLLSKSR
jgi:hypothetical protein